MLLFRFKFKMYPFHLISSINFKVLVFFITLISFGHTSKSPLTNINPVDVVQYHADKVVRAFDHHSLENLLFFNDIAAKIFNKSSEILFNNSCAKSLKKLMIDVVESKPYAIKSSFFVIVCL